MSVADWIEIGRMDELARLDSPIHRRDARAKTIVSLVFIVTVMSFQRYSISALIPFFLYPCALLAVGQIPARDILRKVAVAAPFALVIGMFNPWLDREPMLALGPLVLSGGWISFCSIMIRFVLTVSTALLLVSCTGMYGLAAGLERLGAPRVFVVQLLFLHRYLFVVVEEGVKLIRSVALRSAGRQGMTFRVYGSLVGHLLLRSMDRAERVYRSMAARGFDGEVRMMKRSRFGMADWVFVMGWVAFFAVARATNLAESLGGLVMGSAP